MRAETTSFLKKTTLLDIMAFFFIYAIAGWGIEFTYRSVVDRQIINPGFFSGPYLPIYGFSALIIVTIYHIMDFNIIYTVILGTLMITLLEYITGSIAQSYMGMQLWDYTDQKYHINGLISLRYTIYWAALLLIFLKYMHPAIVNLVAGITHQQKVTFCMLILGLIILESLSATSFYSNLKSISLSGTNNLKILHTKLAKPFP